MKRLVLLAFAFSWLAACERSASAPTSQTPSIPPPSFATVLNERVSVAGTFQDNTCPPAEVVEILDGFLHFLVTEQVGPTSQSITIQVNAEGIEGVGLTTGARYSVPSNSKEEITLTDEPPTFTQDFDLRFRLIREGSPDNLWFRLTFTFTFPPGTETVRRLEIECRA